jgi:hypothetical protein
VWLQPGTCDRAAEASRLIDRSRITDAETRVV